MTNENNFPPRLWATATWYFSNRKPVWTADQTEKFPRIEYLSLAESEHIRQGDREEITNLKGCLIDQNRNVVLAAQNYDRINVIRNQVEAENAKLRAALEWYADPENYGSDDKSKSTGNECFDIICFDFDRNFKPKKDYAGRRAREALQGTAERGE